jgi:PAS domain S-box-containing protein
MATRTAADPETHPVGIATPVERLDVATVIKVLQTVSSEMVLEKLIDTLMRTAIEQAGAERGLLILSRGNEPWIEAEATASGDTVHVQVRDERVTASVLPEAVLNHVLRTRESVVLDDAAAEPAFAADPYIRQRQIRSILCLPLINRAKLIGVFYLENSLTPRTFVPVRIAVLKLLASQAAISLENTRLYRDLEQREAKIRRLVDANIIGIFTWQLEGQNFESDDAVFLEVNDELLRILGYDREELVSGRIRRKDVTPPEWFKRDRQRWVPEHNMAGRLQLPTEKELFRKDGSRAPVLMGAATFEGQGNQGVAFVLDLTDRKRVDEALRRSEAYLAESQRLTHTGSWAYNSGADQASYWSEETFRILGFDPQPSPPRDEELIRRIHPEDRERWCERVKQARRNKGDYEIDYRIVLPDGTIRHIHSIGHPVLDETGKVVERVGTVMDMTERKRAEEELRESERRYHDVQMELAHTNRVATMGQLTASIAHEVSQPIAGTLTNAQAALRWLAGQPPNLEEVRRALARIVNDCNRMGEVIGGIRALVKKAPQLKHRMTINDAILEVVALTQGEVTKNSVTVQTQLAGGLPLVEGDRVQLQQVMVNLIINAVEAMSGVPEGTRDLLISTGKASSEEVLVSVRDSGPGFAPTALERLFDAFYSTKPSGLGLGLSICRSIIEAHGGRLWASANVPRGAAFQFTLPIPLDSVGGA